MYPKYVYEPLDKSTGALQAKDKVYAEMQAIRPRNFVGKKLLPQSPNLT